MTLSDPVTENTRIFAASDLHTDFVENWNLLQNLSSRDYLSDAIIVAGDIADDLKVITKTLRLLQTKFSKVFYVPGNHELWVRNGEHRHSIEKFSEILTVCDSLGVYARPSKVGEYWIVPLFSWYEPDYCDDNGADLSELEGWADFHFCRWPAEIDSVSDYFLKLNEPNIKVYDGPVITLSHFLPRRELLPPASKLRFKGLPLVAGSLAIDRQVRLLNSILHVFGHSHINFDQEIEGVRYIHNAFGYPREMELSSHGLKLILGAGQNSIR